MRVLSFLVVGASLVAVPSAAEPDAGARGDGIETPSTCIPAERCCQVCGDGRACGNSCIQARKTCHKGRGCACNAAEVCRAESGAP